MNQKIYVRIILLIALVLLVVNHNYTSAVAAELNNSNSKIKLYQTELRLKIGETDTLKWELSPIDVTVTVLFYSDNEEIATVDSNGVVTAKRAGTAIVTAYIENGDKAECLITVSSSLEAIEILYVRNNKCTLAVNQKRTLRVRMKPEPSYNTKLIWSSDNEELVVVSDTGEITPKKPGNAIITIQADDGSGVKSFVKLTIKNREKAASKFSETTLSIVDISKEKYTYEHMVSDLKSMEKLYGDFFTLNSLETTYDNRIIYEVILGNPKAKNRIVIQSSIHAREYMTTLLTMKQLELYCKNYYTGIYKNNYYSELFDNVAFHIVPMANPDGVSISQFGLSGINNSTYKKLVRDIGLKHGKGKRSYYTRWKANVRGVDLNRNFNANWNALKTGVDSPCGLFYKGKKAESEVETQTLVQLIKDVKPICAISYHATGSILFWNYGQNGAQKNKSIKLVTAIRNLTNYRLIKNFDKKSCGGFSDWVSISRKTPAVTIEIGTKSCPLPISEFDSIWKKNKMLYITLADMYK